MASFGLQAICLTVLVLVPLYYTDAVPLGSLKTWIEMPLPPRGRPPEPPRQATGRPKPPTSTDIVNGRLQEPSKVPDTVADINESAIRSVEPGPYVEGAPAGDGRGNNRFAAFLPSNVVPVAPPEPTRPKPKMVRISHLDEGLLLRKVQPVYPRPAIAIRQQGTVVLQAMIGRDGSIQGLHAVSGPPLLIGSAMDAVRQWRYKPYLLNGEPVEVETQITVTFVLGG
ncbi:MAG TPA: TonB family protein [Terriglobales bacterium]|nr:TonB family protein [Terriglobales bacterium]